MTAWVPCLQESALRHGGQLVQNRLYLHQQTLSGSRMGQDLVSSGENMFSSFAVTAQEGHGWQASFDP